MSVKSGSLDQTEKEPGVACQAGTVPSTLRPYPSQTLLAVVKSAARQRPDHPALLFKGSAVSYRELDRQSDAFAAGLVALGVTKGDRVALIVPNSPQAIVGQIGAWKAGAIVAPLNPFATGRELASALAECGAKVALVLTVFYPRLKALQAYTPVRHMITTSIKEEHQSHPARLQAGDERLADLLRRYSSSPGPDVPVQPDDPALLLFTGGTTGTPKAAIGSHHALLISGMQLTAWLQGVLVPWTDVILLNMPLFHVYGNAGVLAVALVGHNPLALIPNSRDIDDLLSAIRQTRPAFLSGVPTLFNALMNHPDVQAGKVDLRSIKLCISGAAPLLIETKNRFEKLITGRIVEGYALTESMMATVITPINGPYKPGSTGRPLPDVELRIVGEMAPDSPLPPGEIGEIQMRAPQLMCGYWHRPTATDQVLHDGWLSTGDLGYLDEDGYLFIVDRKKDVMKPDGFQVWPREVEEVIAMHPAVADVGVAGMEDEIQGEAVKAWVVLREGKQATADELHRYCRERLATYKIPKHFEFCRSLPRSMIGKVLRRLLVESHLSPGPRRLNEQDESRRFPDCGQKAVVSGSTCLD